MRRLSLFVISFVVAITSILSSGFVLAEETGEDLSYTFTSAMGMENIAYCSIGEDGHLVINDIVAPGMDNMSVINYFGEDELEALRAEAETALLGEVDSEDKDAEQYTIDGDVIEYSFTSAMGMENIAYCSIGEDGHLVINDIVASGMDNMSVINYFGEDEVTALQEEVESIVLGTNSATENIEDQSADYTTWEYVVNEDVLDYPIVFNKMPAGYNDIESDQPGEILKLHYTTDAYDDGQVYEKYCTVYLPYGYDANDKETKYNVIYFQHGNGGTPNVLWDNTNGTVNAFNMLNNMFAEETRIMEPCIIICPTYYFELDENGIQTSGDAPAGDGRFEGNTPNYYREIIEDLIPQIESQFNVYCEDFSQEGIAASREHRAFAGYSRGSVCTWYVFHHDLPYFKYFMPMSARCIAGDTDISAVTENSEDDFEIAYQYLKEAVDENPDYDFFIVASTGGNNDLATEEMIPEMKYFIEHEDSIFSYGKNTEHNNFYFTCSDFGHYDLYMPYTLANASNIFFK